MSLVRRFEDLQAWQKARELTTGAYRLIASHRFARDWVLADQLRRAAVSTMTNIAEGFDSGSRAEFRRFLRYAARSASEVQSCLYVAKDQDYVTHEGFIELYEKSGDVRRLCAGLMRQLSRRRDGTSPRPS